MHGLTNFKYTLQVSILWSLNQAALVELVLMCSMCLDGLDIVYRCLWHTKLDSHNWHICLIYLAYNRKLNENLFLVSSDSRNLKLVLFILFLFSTIMPQSSFHPTWHWIQQNHKKLTEDVVFQNIKTRTAQMSPELENSYSTFCISNHTNILLNL
jgi:hypothetical protein